MKKDALDELVVKSKELISRSPIDIAVPRKTCAEIMQQLAADHKDLLTAITDEFDNRAIYPERPMIKLSGFNEDEPTIWLLGWRAGEATPIHDHGNSDAGIHVFEGAITETIYVPNNHLLQIGDECDFRVIERELLEKSTVRVTSPYMHVFSKTCIGHTCIHATTLHCYYPQLKTMDYFEVAGDKLRFSDVWEDNG